jgi:hypothetical protein
MTVSEQEKRDDSAHTLLNVPLKHLAHAPPLPALEYVPGVHCSCVEVTDKEHLNPAGHAMHVSVAPFEYIPFPQVSWAMVPMGAFAQWSVTVIVFCGLFCNRQDLSVKVLYALHHTRYQKNVVYKEALLTQ